MSRYDDEVFRRFCGVLGSLGVPGTFAYPTELSGQMLPYMVALAGHERVLPALDHALAVGHRDTVAREIRAISAIRLETNRRRNRTIREVLLELSRAAAAENVAFAVMKGAAWILEDGDAAAPWRWMVDIDVLVDEHRFATLDPLLENIGYRPFLDGKPSSKSFQSPFVRPDGPCLIEVHRHLGWRHDLLPPAVVFGAAQQIHPGLLMPAPWCRAYHAIIHWQIQDCGLSRALVRPKDMIDIDRFLRRADVDWAALAAQARAVGMLPACEAAIALTTTFMGSPCPPEIPITAFGRRHVALAMARRTSALRNWIAREKWRAGTLWRCEKVAYRIAIRNAGPVRILAAVWAARLVRLPALVARAVTILWRGIIMAANPRAAQKHVVQLSFRHEGRLPASMARADKSRRVKVSPGSA